MKTLFNLSWWRVKTEVTIVIYYSKIKLNIISLLIIEYIYIYKIEQLVDEIKYKLVQKIKFLNFPLKKYTPAQESTDNRKSNLELDLLSTQTIIEN